MTFKQTPPFYSITIEQEPCQVFRLTENVPVQPMKLLLIRIT